jgi:phosphate transport system substrate-binding protein
MRVYNHLKSLTLLSVITVVGLSGCGGAGTNQGAGQAPSQPAPQAQAAGSLVAAGSTALQPLVEQAAQQYSSSHSGTSIQVQGGGSGTGLSQVAQGSIQIGNSDIFAEEKQGVDAASLVDHKVAVVGMAAVVNPKVGVDKLTDKQLIDIFTGKVKNWKEVGGTDVKVTLVNRPKSSGTRAVFSKFALKGQQEAQGITQDSSGTVRKIIAETPGAIGYLALSYLDPSVKTVTLDGVTPTVDNILTNKYPVWAYEHMYTKGQAAGAAKDFLSYMVSSDVQGNIVKKLGYIPVTDMKVDRDAKGTVKQK